jgi:predicted CoA-substrate-specific enzyme activase
LGVQYLLHCSIKIDRIASCRLPAKHFHLLSEVRAAMSIIGINIGALTVKVAAIEGGGKTARVMAHQGRPLEVIAQLLALPEFAGAEHFGVSGQLGHISEFAAIQRALYEAGGEFDAVVSLGGESFLVYTMAHGRVINVLAHNKCAAGSGEFLVQLVGRMGLDLDTAIELSASGHVVPLASRCTVHCKSDVTHKLNRHEATPADILKTLHDSMAGKVAALLEKGQNPLRRVLLIGGVTRNSALVEALRAKLTGTALVVLPESEWFEAWGSALLARDKPLYKSPQISHPPAFETLPPLLPYREQVQVMAATPMQAPSGGPMVLGVDAGSTTTKAVLLDPATRALVATHYTRTRDDPVAAVRECLRELVRQVGNRSVGLVGTTGSARELVGACLGTEQVYNEISAHAAGATHFAEDVDTIFEIGGQDAKYIYLRNGVPIGYAMNNACSAGTGSFLEESAQSDLGTSVRDIADHALAADEPVKFKTTCAAFINSDIRIAQQQGQGRDNILAGLVYAIADNYLTKVKGQRPVGRKVLLQGGVALNRAVGYAFAHRVGRPIVIPANPELLGALGVGLLALDRSGGVLGMATDLETLASAEMTLVGQFTCKACKMYCSIERFEVDGRRFPFGGRCSLYENVWKRKARIAPAPDLVEQRAAIFYGAPRRLQLVPQHGPKARALWDVGPTLEAAKSFLEESFGHPNGKAQIAETRIGIPRALTTHSLYPLYATFFSALGMEAVLSAVDPRGELKSHSGFCLPAQIAHGAVLDLAQKGVRVVFLPQVARMPQNETCKDSYLCPITQAGPYFLAKAFPDTQFLSPVLDFTDGNEANAAMTEMAVRELGASRKLAGDAWDAAVGAQTDAECALMEMGRQALAQALADGKPTVLLAGHSYNAYTPEASQSVGKKLSSMGVLAIPADCLMPAGAGPTVWHFANQILNAASLAKQHPNLFLLSIGNFSCTIDAFTHALLASELGAKPYLILEIDAHTADAGVQTRLEAFLDIVQNYHAAQPIPVRPFTPCKLVKDGVVISSDGERVPLTDPRVKLHLLNFSQVHAESAAMALGWLGLHPGQVVPIDRTQLDLGLQSTSGRECLPLPLSIGQLLQILRDRKPGEIVGFFMMRGGAPCAAEAYMEYFERFIAEHQLADVFMVSPGAQDGYLGFGPSVLIDHLSPAIILADILVEIDHVLRVVGAPGSVEQFQREWKQFRARATTLDEFISQLPLFVDRLAALPRTREPTVCPRVVVTGDFFARFSPFFMDGVRDLYAARGIILKPVDLTELFLYVTYDGMREMANNWGLKPGGFALAKACTRMLEPDGQQYLQQWWGYQSGRMAEQRYRELFLRTGLLISRPNDVVAVMEKSSKHVSPRIFGEVTPTVGRCLNAEYEGYDGILLIGPFNCLPFRISEAILKPLSMQHSMPLLSYETDACAVAPAVLRQVDVHIQQVLEHSGRTR